MKDGIVEIEKEKNGGEGKVSCDGGCGKILNERVNAHDEKDFAWYGTFVGDKLTKFVCRECLVAG